MQACFHLNIDIDIVSLSQFDVAILHRFHSFSLLSPDNQLQIASHTLFLSTSSDGHTTDIHHAKKTLSLCITLSFLCLSLFTAVSVFLPHTEWFRYFSSLPMFSFYLGQRKGKCAIFLSISLAKSEASLYSLLILYKKCVKCEIIALVFISFNWHSKKMCLQIIYF